MTHAAKQGRAGTANREEKMANTKKLDRSMRKGVKRAQRRNLKAMYAEMSDKDRKKFVNSEEKVGLKAFLAAKESD